MDINIEKRAEVAFRTLSRPDLKRAFKMLDYLQSNDAGQLIHNHDIKIYRMASGQMAFIARIGKAFRMVFSIENDRCTIQDIVHRDRIERLLSVAN